MSKHLSAALLAALALSAAGCEMNRPPAQAPDAAWAAYKGRLAEQCGEKHLENMPAEKFNDMARDYTRFADTQVQQLIDFDAHNACGKNSSTECFNTGFVQGIDQAGATQAFVKEVCSKS